MVSTKWFLMIVLVFLLSIQSVFAISNVQHSVDGNKVTLTYQGTPPFWINIRKDADIGQAGGYLWAKTYSNSFSYDMSFAINPSKKFYYGVKDKGWSGVNSFLLDGYNLYHNAFIIEDDGTLIQKLSVDGPVVLTKKFYEKYPDKYDFITFEFLDGVPGYTPSGFTALGNFKQGAFFPPPSDNVYIPSTDQILNRSEAFGTSRLIGGFIDSFDFKEVYVLDFKNNLPYAMIPNVYFDLLMHELSHIWGVILPSELEEALVFNGNTYEQGHWETFTGSWVSVDIKPLLRYYKGNDGKYYFVMECNTLPKFNKFDLYSMGLIPSEEVTDYLVIHNNPGQIVSPRCDSPVEVGKEKIRKTFGIQDFIKVLGSRVPSYKDSKKDFTMAFVLVVPKGKRADSKTVDALNWLSSTFPVAWYKSTGMRSTINNVKPNDSKKPEIIDFHLLSKSAVKWTTNEPTIGFVIHYDSITGQDFIYPDTLERPYVYSYEKSITTPFDVESISKVIIIDTSLNFNSYDVADLLK